MSITWNGVSSDTIGVIVEKIPNRYVPTRRFSPQQVAGRNGNVLLVDKAFPNVEQEYEVYLSAESQGLPSVARACAEWLMGPDGYCRLTDSYDTTVYREAFLMGGFDIENILNKFGRCTITFSCKPQKYLLTGDTPIEIPDGTTTTYTGDVVQFDVITGASITSLSATISPTQDLHGYSSPWPAGGGKNKCYESASHLFPQGDGLAIVENGGTFTAYAKVSRNTDVVFSCATSPYRSAAYGFESVPAVGVVAHKLTYAGAGPTARKFNSGNYEYVGFYYGTTGHENTNIMIEVGSTASSWEPYSNICPISGRTGLSVYVGPTQDQQDATTYAVDWTSEAGTVYGGTLDVVTGLLTVTHKHLLLNDTDWTWKTGNFGGGKRYYTQETVQDARNTQSCLTSIYPMVDSITNKVGIAIDTAVSAKQIDVRTSSGIGFDTLSDFKAYIHDNPIDVVYELATPLTYQLTAQEVEALVGTNNVWSSSGDVSVTVTTLLGGIVTNPTPFEARPLLTVSGVGEITVNGKSIQILESVSDFEIDCETMEAEDNSKIYCMDFPELSGGENKIVGYGSITALTVTPRWWTL